MIALATVALLLAALPTIMTYVNLAALRVPAMAATGARIAILIPARDEEAGIIACIECALASTGVDLEVIVLDDQSADATGSVVEKIATIDPRLRLAAAPPLPPGWTGKQHACHLLARLTEAPYLLFLDADVHLASDAASRFAGALADVDLVSGVPRQRMESFAELLIIPMINLLLLGYLPIPLSRRDSRSALGAACGQMIAVRGTAYAATGGHKAIRDSLHDGLKLPRLFRAAGFRTDLVAGAKLATCRMYSDWRSVARGTTKNATEAMAQPVALPIWTLLLLGGHVLPWVMLAVALFRQETALMMIAALACSCTIAMRLNQAIRCREPIGSVPLSPIGVVLLVALQWLALARKWTGKPETWRGRSYPAEGRQ